MAAGLVLQAGNVDIKQARIVTFAGAAKQALAVVGGHVDVAVAPFVLVRRMSKPATCARSP